MFWIPGKAGDFYLYTSILWNDNWRYGSIRFCSPNRTVMKKPLFSLLFIVAAAIFLHSCSRGITVYEAANGKAKCGRYVR